MRGRSIGEIKHAHVQGIRTRVTDVRQDVPGTFAEVIESALAPEPAARFASATEMERQLERSMRPADVAVNEGGLGRAEDRPPRLQRGALLMGIIVAGTAAGLFVVPSWRDRAFGLFDSPPRATGAAEVPLSQTRQLSRVPAPGGQFWGRPSADGRSYTFVDMNGDLGVFDSVSGAQRILTDLKQVGGQAFESSTFSADGTQIAYAWEAKDGARELRILPVAGGASRLVRSDPDEVAHPLDWSRAGPQILVRFERRDGGRGLGVVSSANGAVHRLAAVDATHGTAALSPDGRYVVFDNSQGPEAIERDVFIAAVQGPAEPVVLVRAQSDDFGPLWAPDGDRVLFISDRTGEPSVWGIDVHEGAAAGEPTILHRNIGRVGPSGISMAGKLFYSLQVGLVDVFQATLDFDRDEVVEAPRPVAPSQVGSKMNSDWAPDGRLAYVLLPQAGPGANRTRRLVILDPETGTRTVLNPRLASYTFPQWSPDGRHILVKGTDLQAKLGVYLVNATTGVARGVALVGGQTPRMIGAVSWGADSDTVLLTRNGVGLMSIDLNTGVERLVFDYASEGIQTFTPNPGFRLSPDGRAIAYSAYRRNAAGKDETVLRVKTPGQPGRDLVVANVRLDDWSSESDVLFTQFERGSQSMTLWRVSAAGGPPKQLGLELLGLRNVGVHPDGRHITFTSGFPGSELWALENFLPGRQ